MTTNKVAIRLDVAKTLPSAAVDVVVVDVVDVVVEGVGVVVVARVPQSQVVLSSFAVPCSSIFWNTALNSLMNEAQS